MHTSSNRKNSDGWAILGGGAEDAVDRVEFAAQSVACAAGTPGSRNSGLGAVMVV